MESRRDRNKARTRRQISDVATALFIERGFDAVSVSEVAEAADVARPTVFAHFPHKEDLLFDRFDDTLADLAEAVRGRSQGTSAVAAVRGWATRCAREGEPPLGVRREYVRFWGLVIGSRTLRARARELVEITEVRLAEVMAGDGTPEPELTAALTVAAARAVFLREASAVLGGAEPPKPEAYARRLTKALTLVEEAL